MTRRGSGRNPVPALFCMGGKDMTIDDAIRQADALKPNAVRRAAKVEWLDRVERAVKAGVIDLHEGSDAVEFAGYGTLTPGDTVLLAPEPHAQLYVYWLCCQIDLALNELERYTNSMILYNNAYIQYARWYNSTVKPLPGPRWNKSGVEI